MYNVCCHEILGAILQCSISVPPAPWFSRRCSPEFDHKSPSTNHDLSWHQEKFLGELESHSWCFQLIWKNIQVKLDHFPRWRSRWRIRNMWGFTTQKSLLPKQNGQTAAEPNFNTPSGDSQIGLATVSTLERGRSLQVRRGHIISLFLFALQKFHFKRKQHPKKSWPKDI